MSKTISILACGLFILIPPFAAQAFPGFPPSQTLPTDITLVRNFCGLGFHRDIYGTCIPNGTYAAPVVVPPVVVPAPVVVAPRVCPYGYYYYAAYNRCVLAR